MNVHLLYKPDSEDLNYLKSLLDEKIFITAGDPLPDHGTVDILVAGRPKQEHFDHIGEIKILIIPWTGLPPETRTIMLNYPEVKIYNLHHNASATAEMALSLLLAAAKQVIPFDQRLRSFDWRPRYENNDTVLLAGKNATVLGYGEIGRVIKGYMEALGVQVRMVKRKVDWGDDEDGIYPTEELERLLPETDFLILALPHTEETDQLISHKELDLLPPRSILVNISRGNIVDQEALYNALKENKIYGAGLDVWYTYPQSEEERTSTPPGDFPFHELDNLVMSPHRGGKVQETEKLRMDALAKALNAAAQGKRVPNPVNLNLGY